MSGVETAATGNECSVDARRACCGFVWRRVSAYGTGQMRSAGVAAPLTSLVSMFAALRPQTTIDDDARERGLRMLLWDGALAQASGPAARSWSVLTLAAGAALSWTTA